MPAGSVAVAAFSFQDDDYPQFQYYKGTEVQNKSIRRVISERGKPVYVSALGAGAILVDNGNIKLLGNVKIFNK